MKSCATRQAELKAYLDGELPLVERAAMAGHLLHCAKCREAKTAMTEISRRIGHIDGDALPPALRARILSSVTYTDNQAAGPMPAPIRRHRVRPPLILVGGATAAALIAVILMRPLLFPRESDRVAPEVRSQAAKSPSAPPASFSSEPQRAFGGGSASSAASAPAAAPPAQAKVPFKQDYDAARADQKSAVSAPKAEFHEVIKPINSSPADLEKSVTPLVQDDRPVAGKPSEAPATQPKGGRREEDYMNSFHGDKAVTQQQFERQTANGVARAANKPEAAVAARKAKARAKSQAQRSARGRRINAAESPSAGTAK